MITRLFQLFMLLGVLAIGSPLFAQQNADSVAVTDDTDFGEFMIIASNIIEKGTRLFRRLTLEDQVRVYPKCYMALLHKSGATIEIDKVGVYTVKSLKAQLLAYAKDHSQYPINLTIDNPQSPSYKYKYFHYWGKRCPEPSLGVLLPSFSKVWSRELTFAWYDKHSKDTSNVHYEVILEDIFGEGVFRQTVSQKHITLTLPALDPSLDNNYLIKIQLVKSKVSEGCKSSAIEYLNTQRIRNEYEKFKLKNKQTKSPVVAIFNEMVFWGKRRFVLQIDKCWRKLMKRYPSHPVLVNAYEHFRVLHDLKRAAKGTRKY